MGIGPSGSPAPSIPRLNPGDRPRERLWREGPRALSDAELLAVLLRTGRVGENVLALSQRLLADEAEGFRGFDRLARMDAPTLARVPGMGTAKAATIVAAMEIARRTRGAGGPRAAASSLDVARRFQAALMHREDEAFYVMSLDHRHRILGLDPVSLGNARSAAAGPREIFRTALRRGASAVIVGHNHPGGDPRPSPADVRVTRSLWDGGNLIGVDLLDHLIVADDAVTSLCAEGYIPGPRKEPQTGV